MQYRSLAHTSSLIRGALHRFQEFDLIVGVPRSGVIPAALAALAAHKPYQELPAFLAGLAPQSGSRLREVKEAKQILVLDDSFNNGIQMTSVRERIPTIWLSKIKFGAVYCTPGKETALDLWLETVSYPRFFEWNLLNHPLLRHSCFDMDGVLCEDPDSSENDDGTAYERFLKHARPKFIPANPIGWVITSRLEKYRAATTEWLKQHRVAYGELIMLAGVTAKERRQQGMHATFKATQYMALPAHQAILYVESCPAQALRIYELTGRPVYCPLNNTFYSNDSLSQKVVDYTLRKPSSFLTRVIRRLPV